MKTTMMPMRDKNRYITEYLAKFNVGDEMPSIISVANATGYSRCTIREFYQRLDAMGFIKVCHGKRTVIAKDFLESEEHF